MEPDWQAELDVDDSDLRLSPAASPRRDPPLRRPLQPCSSRIPSLSFHLTQSQSYNSSSPPLPFNPPPVVRTSERVVPGPAGVVQAAMHRRAVAGPSGSSSSQAAARASQEAEGGCDDSDFKDGGVDAKFDFGVLNSISASQSSQRYPLVVGVIKSCKANGLGDFIVSLKDLSGTIEATIHRKVVSDGKFSGKIAMGSVIVLKQVVSFPTSRSTHYLNITLKNVVEVFSKDCESVLIQKLPAQWFKESGCDSGNVAALTKTVASNNIENREITSLSAEIACHGTETVEKIQSDVVAAGSNNKSIGSNSCDLMIVEAASVEIPQNKRLEPISIVPNTNWTDEQLNELFADIEGW